MKKLGLLLVVSLLFTACGTTMQVIDLNPGSIQFIEHRTFWSTTALAIVYDSGKIVGISPGSGTTIAAFTGDVVSAAAVAGGLAYIGTQLPKINTGTSTVNVIAPSLPSLP